MRILLDTHIYLWWIEDSTRLTKNARTIIKDAGVVFVSSATLWEAIIKIGLGKLEADPAALVAGIPASGFETLPVTTEHTLALPRLANHHKDPFDRMLIAQAITEPLRLVTHDEILSLYSDLVILV